MIETIEFKLNGKKTRLAVDGERKLLWVLRTDLGLTGAKYGCGEGLCGACTVLINWKAVRSCQIPVKEVQGRELLTIEGLARDENLHPLQKAFIKNGAFQCGFCTSGMILNAFGMLLENPQPGEGEILKGMNANLCRCGAHNRIVRAIRDAAREMRKRR
jgi:aerobic-type carbon monoxide dehydrogenase small subunit (CoxS/CutS family)